MYREYDGSGTTVTLERGSLSVLDGTKRIALVERRTTGDDGTAELLVRFQLGNHLGSACLELGADGTVISYEEYHPYGSTSYQAVDPAVRAATKRYRFTGMERDEATGLQYHSARYYAPWLGRWTAADPAGLTGGANLYATSRNNPVRFVDPGGLAPEDTDTGVAVRSGLNNPPLPPKLPDEPTTMQQAIASEPPSGQYTPEEQIRIDFNEQMESAATAASANEKAASDSGIGPPGMAESLIPIWGSGRSALYNFQQGNYFFGAAYGALAVSDVFLVRSLFVTGMKLTARSASAGAAWEAGGYALDNFYRQAGRDLVHWTSAKGAAGIASSGRLGGRWGLFALDTSRVPTSRAGQLAWRLLGPESAPGRLALGVTRMELTQPVGLTAVARNFDVPPMFGPWSTYRNLLGLRASPLGHVNLRVGQFLPGLVYNTPGRAAFGGLPSAQAYAAGAMASRGHYTEAVFHQWLLDYGYDAGIYGAVKSGLHVNNDYPFLGWNRTLFFNFGGE